MIRKLSLSLAAVALAASAAQAQSGNVTVEATVLSPLTLTPVRVMQFGNAFPGVSRTIAATDAANSGAIQIIGAGAAQVAISVQSLTTPLQCVGTCTGGTSADITLNVSTAARINTANATPTGATAFTIGTTPANANLLAGNLWLLIGGQMTPAANQAAGLYRGTVQINASYTGN